ncbi:MAG: response regulator [Granulosicoccus sp.]|nr:response regulator [Granulosicoccus sp.]
MAQILAIDDSVSIRKLVSFTLNHEGHEVLLAEDGQAGLDVLQNETPDLIITDIHMPIMNGIEFIKGARELPDHRFTPILVLTTESGSDMKTQGKNAGATGWIVKPFTPERFVELVERVLNR